MHHRRVWILLLALLLGAGCTPAPAPPASAPPAPVESGPAATSTAQSTELVVLAAASLTDAFSALAAAFAAENPDVQVTFSFAGSQQLAQQLVNGAPADVFAVANTKQMQVAVDGGRIDAASVQPFVRNRLVVVTPADNPARLETLVDLARPGIKLVLADAAVPVGQYTLDFLAKAVDAPEFPADYSQSVLANVVSYEDNVRAVLTKVVLGEADAGVVYSSDIGPAQAPAVQQFAIPEALNVIATYPLAPVADSRQPNAAAAFVAFVLSPAGQAILEEYGFIGVER